MSTDVWMVLATFLAAIAAGFSAVAAFQQESAIYSTNLYNRQVDATATFSAAASATLESSSELLDAIANSAANQVTGTSDIATLRDRAIKQETELKKSIQTFALVFPFDKFKLFESHLSTVVRSNRELLEAIAPRDGHPHLNFDTPAEAIEHFRTGFRRTSRCIQPELTMLANCARQRFQTGHSVDQTDAQNCVETHYKDVPTGSDAEVCWSR